jgi:hypothetical protein
VGCRTGLSWLPGDLAENMTGPGNNRCQTACMDLLELARTIQDDHRRQVEEATRRRRLIDGASPSVAASRDLPPGRPTGTSRSGQSVPTAPATR